MEALVTRPAAACCRRAVSSAPTSRPLLLVKTTVPSATRQKSTTARTKRALNIAPHPSFLHANGDISASGTGATARPSTDQIIFNPPSSAPSVYHTPFKFLPKNDPRRRANLASSLFSTTTTSTSTSTSPSTPPSTSTEETTSNNPVESFPPIEKPPVLKPRHHLTKADIEEMRRLRETDPATNSVLSLARKFQCSTLFVLMCCQAPKEHKEKIKELNDKVQGRWGPRRRAAREDRARRNVMVFNGEI